MKERHRIPDLEVRPRRIFTEEQVRGHVADFIAQGGVITQCSNQIGKPRTFYPISRTSLGLSGWTDERRQKQREIFRALRPWEKRARKKPEPKKPTEEQ